MKNKTDSEYQADCIDENTNLFQLNIETINNEIINNKSRLKAVRNSLIDVDFNKRNRTQVLKRVEKKYKYNLNILILKIFKFASLQINLKVFETLLFSIFSKSFVQ